MTFKTYHIFFRNFANPLKLKIIYELRKKDGSVNEIVEKLEVEQSKVSHALASLKKCSIVESKQKGKKHIYSLNKKTITPILKLLEKHVCVYCKNKCGFKK